METVDSPWIAARSFGVQFHDSGPGGFGADPQLCELGKARACINAVTYNTVLVSIARSLHRGLS